MPVQPRILVIDDDETILELLKDTLSDYYIATAHDSLEGVEMMLSERFDLMIIDLGMPVLDGVELIQKIRANSPFDKIPILVLSAYPELRMRLSGSDVQAIMSKPFSIDQLQHTVASIIGGGNARATNASPSQPPASP